MIVLCEKHISKRSPPENLKKEDLPLFSHEFSKEIRETHILELKNVLVLKDHLLDLKNLRTYFDYTHSHKSLLRRLLFFLRLLLIFRRGKSLESGVWIIDEWSNGYFHWLTDALPRLVASNKFFDNRPVVLPDNYKKEKYITQSLQLIDRTLEFYNPRKMLVVKNLLLPSHTSSSGNYNKKLINKLRNLFLEKYRKSAGRRIFISRQKAEWRKITNEDEVVNLLKSYDYEIHYFEEYSFKRQVEIMAETKSLIGLHGAGLTNMLFMPENGQVLELRNRNDSHRNCYYSLASDLGHKYYYQLNDGDRDLTLKANLMVNLNEFKRNLDMMTA